jgi:hypothetical protein
MLHVDLVRLIPGERRIQSREHAIPLKSGEFVGIEEVGGSVLVAEEEPGLARGSGDRAVPREMRGTVRCRFRGPIMMMGVSPLGGRRNALIRVHEDRNGSLEPGGQRSARKVEQTPIDGRPASS